MARFHDLLFTEIGKALSGNVLIIEVNKTLAKYKAISYYKKKHYQTYFYLRKRPDCGNSKFILLVSIYRDYDKDDHDKFKEFEEELKKEFKK